MERSLHEGNHETMSLPLLIAIVFAQDRVHRITASSLPAPYGTPSADKHPRVTARDGAPLHVEAGYRVTEWATGLDRPRKICVAPNGDVFTSESYAGRITLLRPGS